MTEQNIVPIESISQKIYVIRGTKVMLDADLATLYGVTTGNLNLAVRRNIYRFPADFMFELTKEEHENLILQFAISSWGGRRHRPLAFTEHGVAMISSILHSHRAVEINILIIRAFIGLREILASNKELSFKVSEIEREQKLQNRHINTIYRILDKLVTEPIKPKEPIGFRRN